MKRTIASLFVALMLLSVTVVAGRYTDVPDDAWYASVVEAVSEKRLMNGVGDGAFAPEEPVSVAEAVTMASRAYAAVHTLTIPAASGDWFAPYRTFATACGLLQEGEFDDFTRPASRAETAVLFYRAVSETLEDLSDVSVIHDVPPDAAYASAVLSLYRAGVLTGSDEYGSFYGEHPVTRAEAAAILLRAHDRDARVKHTILKKSTADAAVLAFHDNFKAYFGAPSGFLLDNRGGLPALPLNGVFGPLSDVSDTTGTAFIRELSPVSSGTVTVTTRLAVSGEDGAFVSLRDAEGDDLFRLLFAANRWQAVYPDGTLVPVSVKAPGLVFSLGVTVDLDNRFAAVYLDGADGGRHPLLSDKPLCAFVYGTAPEAVCSLRAANLYIRAGLTLYEDFSADSPFPRAFDEALIQDGVLTLTPGSTAPFAFPLTSGNSVLEFAFFPADGVSVALSAAGSTVMTFTDDGSDFSANGIPVYENAVRGLWYRLRFVLDTHDMTADIFVNGRKTAVVPFAAHSSGFDAVTFTAMGQSEARFDDLHVFRLAAHDDYVPAPVVPSDKAGYLVGVNTCPLWRNGDHYGWACITPYAEPVLGWYDEGSPETADWEIKYLVEHGVDFQAVCWFPDKADAPLKSPAHSAHLHDGYMYARYADALRYCLIYEAANGALPASVDSWKNYYVPYLVENYFKDPRYMSVDNKPLFYIFGAGNLTSPRSLGSAGALKEALDYLEEQVKTLGFDGMIFVCCGGAPSASVAAMGFDATSAYHWGVQGFSLSHNIASNNAYAGNGFCYHIPTVSTGFNAVAWNGARTPVMTADDFRAALAYVRDDYLPQYAKEPWNERLVMLSSWNEFGEGTYIFPTVESGFGYLDALREVFTDEHAASSVNTLPTEAQKARINRLYPAYRRLIRAQGLTAANDTEDVFTVAASSGSPATDTFSSIEQNGSTLVGVTGHDARIEFPALESEGLDLDDVKIVRVRADIPKGEAMEVFYTTKESPAWEGAKGTYRIAESDGMSEIVFDFSDAPNWTGTLKSFRVDPTYASDKPFTLESVTFMRRKPTLSRTVTADGMSVELPLPPERTINGEIVFPFDSVSLTDVLLGLFAVWDDANDTLTFTGNGTSVAFTVGADAYRINGTPVSFGYTLESREGLPMIPLARLCDAMGLVFSFNTVTGAVITSGRPVSSPRNPLDFTFNTPGDTEGFVSEQMALFCGDGYLSCLSLYDDSDPILTLVEPPTPFAAEDYAAVDLRVRYDCSVDEPHPFVIYYATADEPYFSESKTVKILLSGASSGGEWETYTVPFKATGTVTALRVDPFNAVGRMDIDYLRFIPKEES